jgi:uncharacterized protein (TIGR03067 family)
MPINTWRSLRRCISIAALVILVPAAAADDLADLQGHWDVIDAYTEGKRYSELIGGQMQIDGDRLVLKNAQREERAILSLDESTLPKRLDVRNPDKPDEWAPGIYQLTGDDLQWVWDPTGSKAIRPSEFQSRAGSEEFWLILRRKPRE